MRGLKRIILGIQFIALYLCIFVVSSAEEPANSFFVDENIIYTINHEKPYGIFTIDIEKGNSKLLYHQDVKNIYDGGDVIYFEVYQKRGIFSIKKDGTEFKKIIDVDHSEMMPYKDFIFYSSQGEYGSEIKYYNINTKVHTSTGIIGYPGSGTNVFYKEKEKLYINSGHGELKRGVYTFDSSTKDFLSVSDEVSRNQFKVYSHYIIATENQELTVYDYKSKTKTIVDNYYRDRFEIINSQLLYCSEPGELKTTYDFETGIRTQIESPLKSVNDGTSPDDKHYRPRHDVNNNYIRVNDTYYKFNEGEIGELISIKLQFPQSEKEDSIAQQAFIFNISQYEIGTKQEMAIKLENMDYNFVVNEIIDYDNLNMHYTFEDKTQYNGKSYTRSQERFYHDGKMISNYGSKEEPKYVYDSPYEQELIDTFATDTYIPRFEYYALNETKEYYIFDLSLEQVIEFFHYNSYVDYEITWNSLISNYEGKLYINKKTGHFETLSGVIDYRKPVDNLLNRPVKTISYKFTWDYNKEIDSKRIKGLEDYMEKRFTKIINWHKSGDLKGEEKLVNTWVDKTGLYEGKYLLYLYRYDGTENSILYNALSDYVKHTPKDMSAAYRLLAYEYDHNKPYTQEAIKILKSDWNYRALALDFELALMDIEKQQKFLDQMIKDYPLDQDFLSYKMAYYFNKEMYADIIKFYREHRDQNWEGFFYMSVAAEKDSTMYEKGNLGYYLYKAYNMHKDPWIVDELNILYVLLELSYKYDQMELATSIVEEILFIQPGDMQGLKYKKLLEGKTL